MTNEELKKRIGENIRRLRKSAGYTQAQLAELVDRDASTIASIEGGRRLIGVELLTEFAAEFSVSVDSLLQPEDKVPHLVSITGMLGSQSNAALAHLEPIIRAWMSEYGDPKFLVKKNKRT